MWAQVRRLGGGRVGTPRLSFAIKPHRSYATSAANTRLHPHFDFKFMQKHVDSLHKNAQNRNVDCDVRKVVRLYEDYCKLQTEISGVRQRRHQIADSLKSPVDKETKTKWVEEGKKLKDALAVLEQREQREFEALLAEARKVPNTTHPDAPVGPEDKATLLREFGTVPTFDFPARTHEQLAQELDLIDFESASTVSGSKFYYLKNEAALLELGLINWAVQKLVKRGYTPVITPDIVKHRIAEGTGFQPKGDPAQKQIYTIEHEDMCLIGTSEIPLGGMYADKIIPIQKLPIRMVGFSHCFRAEAGTAGKESRGLYRVHQFSKVEMFTIAPPSLSDQLHQEMLEIEQEIHQDLGLRCRVLDMPTEELGAPAYRKFDIEAWMPFKQHYGEITSTSNCTDYQSRRLNIRYQIEKGHNEYVHTLNGTAVAIPRVLLSLLEYGQQRDGSVKIPSALVPFVGFDLIRPRRT